MEKGGESIVHGEVVTSEEEINLDFLLESRVASLSEVFLQTPYLIEIRVPVRDKLLENIEVAQKIGGLLLGGSPDSGDKFSD